jgi:EAL domain-containing protein (putative c-di-GMP-specific phosphodiesterase class I)
VQAIRGTGESDEGIVAQAIISLGHNLNLKVVGEGVETAVQFDFLKRHSCDEVQGYHFGRPMPADEFVRFTHRRGERSSE